MEHQHRLRYYINANTAQGFQSHAQELCHHAEINHITLLQGGLSQTKTFVLQQLALRLEQQGVRVIELASPKHPDYLDGLLAPDHGLAWLDGSATRTLEPDWAVGQMSYVDMGICYQKEGLGDKKPEIAEALSEYRTHYQRACNSLWAMSELTRQRKELVLTSEVRAKLIKRGQGILGRLCPQRKRTGGERRCFLSAIHQQGYQTDWSLVAQQDYQVYQLVDRYGLGEVLLQTLSQGARERGYQVISCMSLLHPEHIAHLVIPEAQVAFVTTNPQLNYADDVHRRLRLDSMIPEELYKRHKARLRFSEKVSSALLEEAVAEFQGCRGGEEQVEGLYAPYIEQKKGIELAEQLVTERSFEK